MWTGISARESREFGRVVGRRGLLAVLADAGDVLPALEGAGPVHGVEAPAELRDVAAVALELELAALVENRRATVLFRVLIIHVLRSFLRAFGLRAPEPMYQTKYLNPCTKLPNSMVSIDAKLPLLFRKGGTFATSSIEMVRVERFACL